MGFKNRAETGGGINDIVDDTTPQLGGDLDGQGNNLNNMGVLFLTEQAEADASVSGKGQLWVDLAAPNVLMFTDEDDTDFIVATDATTILASLTTVGILDTGNATAIVDAATLTTAGKIELATIAETNTGTATDRAVTPDGLSSAVKSIMLSGAGGAPLITAGSSDPTKIEFATNDINTFVLDFDASTEEHAFWSFPMPDNWDGGVVNAIFYWTNAAGLAAETVDWGIAGGSWGDSDALDAALGSEITTTDTFLAQDDLHISGASGDITIANAAAGEWVNIVVARKVATDDLTGDARLMHVKLEYTIDAYSE